VLDHERRRLRHFAVTTQTTGAWVLHPLRDAFPYDTGQSRRLICDSDPSSLLTSAVSSPMSA
jgi:hypothetical protein